MSGKHTILDKAQDQLKVWDKQIDELKAKADLAEAQSRRKYQEEINRLKKIRQDLADRIDQYDQDSKAGLAELEKGLKDFRQAFTSALDKFNPIK